MLSAIAPLLDGVDVVLVYGDANSTLAGALAAAQAGVPVAHVEAGMRSCHDRSMPEELNRVLTDHASALLLCSSSAAADTLRAEQVVGAVEVVGDVMVDVFELLAPRADRTMLETLGVASGEYLLATAHRAGNVDSAGAAAGLGRRADGHAAAGRAAAAPAHPRALEEAGLLDALDGVIVAPPLGYLEFTALVLGAKAVLTDSGGVQKEAYLAGVPCITLRSTTEWRETIDAGWNVLVDLDAERRAAALSRGGARWSGPPLYGDGQAGARVVDALVRMVGA